MATLTQAIKNRSINELKEVVEAACILYMGEPDGEPTVHTVYGDLPLSMIFDEDTKWEVLTAEWVVVMRKAKAIPISADQKIEIAKLIATNPYFRAAAGKAAEPVGGLL